MELNFKMFVENQGFEADLKDTILKIPKSHQKLIKGYKFKWEGGNTLNGDSKHVGEIDEKKKQVKVAAPWYFSREFTVLHEIAHAVWKYKMDEKLRDQWSKIVKNTPDKKKENDEELFCHAYANVYTKHKVPIHTHKTWENFIKKIP